MKTASRARAVQLVRGNRRGARDTESLGLPHPDAEGRAVEGGLAVFGCGQGVLDLRVQVSLLTAMTGAISRHHHQGGPKLGCHGHPHPHLHVRSYAASRAGGG